MRGLDRHIEQGPFAHCFKLCCAEVNFYGTGLITVWIRITLKACSTHKLEGAWSPQGRIGSNMLRSTSESES